MDKYKDDLIEFYKLVVDEEHYFLEAHQKRIAFYSGIVTALVAATIAGLFKATNWYQLLILCTGPILIFLIANIAIDGTFRFYQRFIETITIRAKLEQELGLTKSHSDTPDEIELYWGSESIIPPRHIESRKKYESSKLFIDDNLKKGYHFWTIRLFRGFQYLSIIIIIFLLVLAVDAFMS